MQRRPGGRQQLPRPANWRELGHTPWENLDTSALQNIDTVCRVVGRTQIDNRAQESTFNAHRSAVLIPLFSTGSDPRVLLTRRSDTLTTHQGQIAFPGGRLEPGETTLQAALRETREEIGIDASQAHVVTELSAHRVISSSSHIVPHVVRLTDDPIGFSLNAEVERVFSISLSELIRPDTFVQEHWVFPDREVVVPIFYLDDETIWGATARMLQELLMLAISRE